MSFDHQLPGLGTSRSPSITDSVLMNTDSEVQDIQHSNDILEDVFGSPPNSPILPVPDVNRATPLALSSRDSIPNDIPRLRSVHVTNGYREGLSTSKEQHVQAGFDEGYVLGGEIGMRVGWILGILEGLKRNDLLEKAQEELKVEIMMGSEYFGPDAIWTYDVAGDGEEGSANPVTFTEVADSHPLVQKWKGKVEVLMRDANMTIRNPELS